MLLLHLVMASCVHLQSTCEQRGLSRESQEGKKYSSSNWEKSVDAIVDVPKEAHALKACIATETAENVSAASS